jgi:small conductance mechanosensitive channel
VPLAVAPITDVTLWARSNGLEIVLFLTGAVLLSRTARAVGHAILRRIDARSRGTGLVRTESAKHVHVVTQVSMWAIVVLVWCTAIFLTLQRLGVPVTGLVAPATVVAVALGFGAQRVVQDVLAGLFIIAEHQYGFGDNIRVSALGQDSGATGTVEEVTLRITRMRTVNGEVVIIPNGQIIQVTNQSRDWARAVIDVPVPATADVGKVREVLGEVGEEARKDKELGPLLLDSPSVVGVESIELDTLHVRIVARTLPGKQFAVGRELRERVALAFRAEGISVSASLDTLATSEALERSEADEPDDADDPIGVR